MINSPTPRNTSRRVRTAKVDALHAAGFPLAQAHPNEPCGQCHVRMGDHILVLDGDITDDALLEMLMTQRVVGTLESPIPEVPYACGTFGALPRLAR